MLTVLAVASALLYVAGGAYTGRLAYRAHARVHGCWWVAERAAYRAGAVWPVALPVLLLARVARRRQ